MSKLSSAVMNEKMSFSVSFESRQFWAKLHRLKDESGNTRRTPTGDCSCESCPVPYASSNYLSRLLINLVRSVSNLHFHLLLELPRICDVTEYRLHAS